MRTMILGDLHGRSKALLQVLQRSQFDYENDRLIFLGDVCDRGEEPLECIREILKIRNRVLIMGNHDQNFQMFVETTHDMFNGENGFFHTKMMYISADDATKEMTAAFLKEMRYYFVDEKNNLYVHGGINRWEPIERQDEYSFVWDRSMLKQAKSCVPGGHKLNTVDNFNEIFIGHTPTLLSKTNGVYDTLPICAGGVWNLDTGAGFAEGRLTLMDRDTHEFVQSDFIGELYPKRVA